MCSPDGGAGDGGAGDGGADDGGADDGGAACAEPGECKNMCAVATEFQKLGSDMLYTHCHACKGDECKSNGTVVCHDDNQDKNPGHNLCYDKDGKVFNCDKWIEPNNITVFPSDIPADQASNCGTEGVGQQAIMDPAVNMARVKGCDPKYGGMWVNCKEYKCDVFKKGGTVKVCECMYPKNKVIWDPATDAPPRSREDR